MTGTRLDSPMKAPAATRLGKTCGNGGRALKGIALVVTEGAFFALPAPNGAGESTAAGVTASPAVKSAGRGQASGTDAEAHPEATTAPAERFPITGTRLDSL